MPRPHWLIDEIDLTLPALPAGLEGLRIAQLSDLHIERPEDRYDEVIHALQHAPIDLVFLTGDYISWPENEELGVEVLAALLPRLRPRLGVMGVFGNHDTPRFRREASKLPVRWLDGHVARDLHPDLEIFGVEMDRMRPPDLIAQLQGWDHRRDAMPSDDHTGEHHRPLRLLLSHLPTLLPVAADLGMDVMFSGHTHGGQCRLPGGMALVNSTDLPLRLTSGILRHQDTLGVITRGLGRVGIRLRAFCPPHLPIYTFRRGKRLGVHTHHIVNLRPW